MIVSKSQDIPLKVPPSGNTLAWGSGQKADKKEEKEELDKKQVQLYSRVQQGLPSDKKLTTQYVWSTRRRILEVEYVRAQCGREEEKQCLVNNISGGKNISVKSGAGDRDPHSWPS